MCVCARKLLKRDGMCACAYCLHYASSVCVVVMVHGFQEGATGHDPILNDGADTTTRHDYQTRLHTLKLSPTSSSLTQLSHLSRG